MFIADFFAEIFRYWSLPLPFISSNMDGFAWGIGIFITLVTVKILHSSFGGDD